MEEGIGVFSAAYRRYGAIDTHKHVPRTFDQDSLKKEKKGKELQKIH